MPRADNGVSVEPADEALPGAAASFPFDATLIQRFRTAFPRARWREDRCAWFVPGTTAEQRLNRWLQRELSGVLAYADERGRDAFAFDPIESPYLVPAEDLLVRTPYSKTIVEQLRAVPWAWWDGEQRFWRVPFRSIDELRKRWPAIEAAAKRNEPEERKRRREEAKASPGHQQTKAITSERRRRRYPVPADQLPPCDRSLMTHEGSVVFTDVTGELVDEETARHHHPWSAASADNLIWANWRRPTHAELVRTWPARQPPGDVDMARGWWQATIEELREARRKARSVERGRETRRNRRYAVGPEVARPRN
jgi:hypothetical protein